MLGTPEARLVALVSDIRQRLRSRCPDLPPAVFSALVHELARLKLEWERGAPVTARAPLGDGPLPSARATPPATRPLDSWDGADDHPTMR